MRNAEEPMGNLSSRFHSLQQRVIAKYVVDRPPHSTRLGLLELYGTAVVASSVDIPLINFGIGHMVIPIREIEQEVGGH